MIGTGASAIQFIPEIATQAAHLTVFQRTPPWIHPRPDVEIPARLRATFNAVPLTARACRDAIYLLMEARALGFAVHPKLMAPLERMARRHLENQVADPALRARLTPDYTIGCKRIRWPPPTTALGNCPLAAVRVMKQRGQAWAALRLLADQRARRGAERWNHARDIAHLTSFTEM